MSIEAVICFAFVWGMAVRFLLLAAMLAADMHKPPKSPVKPPLAGDWHPVYRSTQRVDSSK